MDAVPWLPEAPGSSAPYANAFRANIKAFVARFARQIVLPEWQKASIYLLDLTVAGGSTIKLHIYEEHLWDAAVCDQCRCMGECLLPIGI
jgi:hypothetical protein